MEKSEKQVSGDPSIQVFELTMDNSEDQDELNRRFHKAGESNDRACGTNVGNVQGIRGSEQAK